MAQNYNKMPDHLKGRVDAAIRKEDQEKADRRARLSAANVEPDSSDGPAPVLETQEVPKAAHLRVHSIRKRLGDCDGVSVKAVLDGCTKAGLIPDDGPEYIEAVTFTQEKGKEEKTILTFTWEEDDD